MYFAGKVFSLNFLSIKRFKDSNSKTYSKVSYYFNYYFTVWAETGEFRENSHNTMSAVASMDHTQMNFQTPVGRNRNRDRKSDGEDYCILRFILH